MSNIKVQFPKPCSENWDEMTPNGCNRHCSTCATTVHDLSSMTVEEAEALLDSGEKVCVRAAIQPDGNVKVAESAGSSSRRIFTAIGASVSLATAACQTASLGEVTPRYEISGKLKRWAWKVKLESDTGKIHTAKIWGDKKFQFSNLRSGTYTLSFIDDCDVAHPHKNIVIDKDLNLGEVEWKDDNMCIIVGVMYRAEESSSG